MSGARQARCGTLLLECDSTVAPDPRRKLGLARPHGPDDKDALTCGDEVVVAAHRMDVELRKT